MKLKIASDITKEVIKQGKKNRGYLYNRTKDCDKEKAFADMWEKENQPCSWVDQGFGLLQNLFIENRNMNIKHKIILDEASRYITATAIQWLGTKCGWSFLGKALKECGYKIVENESKISL